MRVRRLKTDCCGMERDKVYEGREVCGGAYMECQLPDGDWTSPHFIDKQSDDPWFEMVGGPDAH